jgi:hypothetical protein
MALSQWTFTSSLFYCMNRSGDGRTLSEVEWKQLRLDVGKLKTDLDMVEVGSEIPESAPSIA